jgi:hypothetical protein
MSTHADAQHAYFARVPNRLLADLRSADGPILTFVEADGQLHLNRAALGTLARQPRQTGDVSAPIVVAPILFTPGRSALTSSRRKRPAE